MRYLSVKTLLPESDTQQRRDLEEKVVPIFHLLPEQGKELQNSFYEDLLRTLWLSDFAADILHRLASKLSEQTIRFWYQPLTSDLIEAQVVSCFKAVNDQVGTPDDRRLRLYKLVRDYRNLFLLRLIFRDANALSTLDETMSELSWMADHMIHASIQYLYPLLCEEMGEPCVGGEPQHLYVLALGKLGAFELNLSSDVDLMFGFSQPGTTVGGAKEYTNQEFFIRLGQRLIKFLSEVTEDGFVFRVDMRLRPFGQSGSLAWSTDAMVGYYQEHGREWERYALIKARAIAGDRAAGNEFLAQIRPFVFRRYIDYGVFHALREMKSMIKREVERKKADDNIKIGQGGIREIEFVAQVFQLLRGGKYKELRNQHLVSALNACCKLALLPAEVVSELLQAYVFLRQLEHRLQAVGDRQTQVLPMCASDRFRIARSMSFENWTELTDQLLVWRDKVHGHFNDLIRDKPSSKQVSESDLRWVRLWQSSVGESDEEPEEDLLDQLSSQEARDFESLIRTFREVCIKKRLQSITLERLDVLMPMLLQKVYEGEIKVIAENTWARLGPASSIAAPELNVQWAGVCETFRRIQALLVAILRRSAYLALFIENPSALNELVKLVGASPWIADQLASHPSLLDELLNESLLYQPPNKTALKEELTQQLLRVPSEDLELQMETLRTFKQVHVLRTAAAEITSRLALMNVSDYLTYMAEVLLEASLSIVWQQMVDRYGYPTYGDGSPATHDLVVIGYGKLGGIELSYSSDLDLVFLYGVPSNALTTGERPVENMVFYTRLVQRLIHVLSTHTVGGVLYEVDLRLRPSGSKGLVVSSIDAFEDYQQRLAWNWEHQALVRARVVVGTESSVADRFQQIRADILQKPKSGDTLREKVHEMRDKMRAHLGSKKADNCFHLKYDAGGMVDIEFIAQYMVLLHGPSFSALLEYTDNIRIFECLEKLGLLADLDARGLREAYLVYRAAVHRLTLQNRSSALGSEAMLEHRALVQKCWLSIFGGEGPAEHSP